MGGKVADSFFSLPEVLEPNKKKNKKDLPCICCFPRSHPLCKPVVSTRVVSSNSINWELVRHVTSQAPPKTYRIRNAGSGAPRCLFSQGLQLTDAHQSVRDAGVKQGTAPPHRTEVPLLLTRKCLPQVPAQGLCQTSLRYVDEPQDPDTPVVLSPSE